MEWVLDRWHLFNWVFACETNLCTICDVQWCIGYVTLIQTTTNTNIATYFCWSALFICFEQVKPAFVSGYQVISPRITWVKWFSVKSTMIRVYPCVHCVIVKRLLHTTHSYEWDNGLGRLMWCVWLKSVWRQQMQNMYKLILKDRTFSC